MLKERPHPHEPDEEPPEARSDVRVTLNCTYCHDALARDEAVYCATCLAPQHQDCFAAHGQCSVQGCSETLVLRPGELNAKPAGRDLVPLAALFAFVALVLACAFVVGAVLYSEPPPQIVVEPAVEPAIAPEAQPVVPAKTIEVRPRPLPLLPEVQASRDPTPRVRPSPLPSIEGLNLPVPSELGLGTARRLHKRAVTSGRSLTAAEEAYMLAVLREHHETQVRSLAVSALAHAKQNRDALVAALIVILHTDGDEAIRARCASSLGSQGRGLRPPAVSRRMLSIVEALCRAIREDSARDVKIDALTALGSMGEKVGDRAAAVAIAALEDKSELVRRAAIEQLGHIAPHERAAVPKLLKLFADDTAELRGASARLLATLGGPDAESIIPTLIGMLRADDPDEVLAACEALGRFGPAGSEAVPLLIERLADPDDAHKRAAARALGRIGAPAAPALTRLRNLMSARQIWDDVRDAIEAIEADIKRSRRR